MHALHHPSRLDPEVVREGRGVVGRELEGRNGDAVDCILGKSGI